MQKISSKNSIHSIRSHLQLAAATTTQEDKNRAKMIRLSLLELKGIFNLWHQSGQRKLRGSRWFNRFQLCTIECKQKLLQLHLGKHRIIFHNFKIERNLIWMSFQMHYKSLQSNIPSRSHSQNMCN